MTVTVTVTVTVTDILRLAIDQVTHWATLQVATRDRMLDYAGIL
jgi:hypothetical protein